MTADGNLAQLHEELTALRSQVDQLQRSQELFGGILESSHDCLAAVDLEYRLIAFNQAYKQEFESRFNTSLELGTNLIDILTQQSESLLEWWQRALQGEEFTVTQEVQGDPAKPDGANHQPKSYEITFSPICDQHNQIIGALHRAHDISLRKQAEAALKKTRNELEMRVAERTAELVNVNRQLQAELDDRTHIETALRESQARFAGILEIASDAIIAVDAQQCITLFNQGAEKIFGYTASEAIGQSLDILLPSRFAHAHRHHVSQFGQAPHQARRMGERSEIYGRRRDGSEFPAEASISKLQIGNEIVFTVILRDVSERKQVENERRQAKQALERVSRQNELILNSVGEGLCGLDLQGNITFANPAAARLLGYRIQELRSQPIHLILPRTVTEDTSFTSSRIYAALQTGLVYHVTDEAFQRRDGTTFPVEYISTPIREQGEIIGAVVTFRDISDRLVVERMKDEFISVVSHELRTPLTSIHGSLGMLASGLLPADSDKGKRLLQIAVDSTNRLVRLINDILDIERIESGKVTMEKAICNVADLMREAVNVVQAIADKFEVSLEVVSLTAQIWADPDRIIQTLTNLLSNAIKFSPQGGTVWLTAERTGEEIWMTVKDRGRGIPADKLDTIFERFQQVDASDSRNHDGTGLGLAICRSIVQQHAGRIWVESVLGEGSTFYVALPPLEENAIAADFTVDSPLVLICDDDDATRNTLKHYLEPRGYQTLITHSGKDAIEQAIAHHPNVIILDLLMPGMNGWDVINTLKGRQDTQSIPIIICSVSSPSQSNYPSQGFISWVSKPIDEVSLFQSLRQALMKGNRE
ncbi:PAS domain S-box protein [Oscillatoria sp. FACHB-1407]|uniref:hybrid sensor histidine kinase/response regulator n=1 Tax=Oscillatoria sp. FACHB-1407 TaxID=2692847 RepID=UPI0016864FDC|nr:PAS domain S-box protein [Oscillatoria sp. FACHB-1407]MBD2460969.1 PAS domain S-box protein [Oscillatoria sp. FACHB-1407]